MTVAASDLRRRSEGASVSRRSLPILTQSSITTFRRCLREYWFKYIELFKPAWKSDALHFGTLFHIGLNAWWYAAIAGPGGVVMGALHRLCLAIDAMRAYAAKEQAIDVFTLAKAEALIIGYTARWGMVDLETVAVEKRFRVPIVNRHNVEMSASGVVYELEPIAWNEGAIDVIVRKFTRGDWQHFNVEHKTTSADISTGSDYWRHKLALDPQVSTYDAASKVLGYDVRGTVYDVIRKPEMAPLKATPEELKKYTKPTKAEPIPRLYANQREADETVDEYRDRIIADIIARPNWYFARHTVVRLEHDEGEHEKDVRETAEMIRFAEERNAWPRSPNACERYRKLCEYFPVCSGETSITDGTRYVKKTAQHEELER